MTYVFTKKRFEKDDYGLVQKVNPFNPSEWSYATYSV